MCESAVFLFFFSYLQCYEVLKFWKRFGLPSSSLLFCVFLQGIFIKDSNSLAYYNVTPSSVVQLQLKERGGRKK